DSESFLMLKSYLDRLGQAKLVGDVAGLKALDAEVRAQADMQATHKAALKERIDEALAALPGKTEPDAEMLGKLAQSSRTSLAAALIGSATIGKRWALMTEGERVEILNTRVQELQAARDAWAKRVVALESQNASLRSRVNALGQNPFCETVHGQQAAARGCKYIQLQE